ncbi:hypothetical protein F5148DRAFT_1223036 [Russula earlei]|uniref:Uncharacterized protein n=1 Tax=Russula earlei TaxID=71964 RepID=A0ACC0U2L4_9AGAM|nr:hypothetical protein F5148DRAFT_1223036 [Russula earlei]
MSTVTTNCTAADIHRPFSCTACWYPLAHAHELHGGRLYSLAPVQHRCLDRHQLRLCFLLAHVFHSERRVDGTARRSTRRVARGRSERPPRRTDHARENSSRAGRGGRGWTAPCVSCLELRPRSSSILAGHHARYDVGDGRHTRMAALHRAGIVPAKSDEHSGLPTPPRRPAPELFSSPLSVSATPPRVVSSLRIRRGWCRGRCHSHCCVPGPLTQANAN